MSSGGRRSVRPDSAVTSPSPPPEERALPPWPISDRLRDYLAVQYELVRVLGTGGMGTVLLANERALDRLVAIKVLHADKATDAEARERFRREARSAAKLTHPNIVPLLTFGDVSGDLYFVMGYVEGETLAAQLERVGRLAPDEARTRLAELADALEYAHKAGIVHRDLKPENILLDAATGRAMLTDFGIARDLGHEASLTSTGIIVGTPHYMSPEQASGERIIDGRSDIYSLGVIGYRMVSGTLPFGGANVRDVITQHLTASPAPLPQAVSESSPALSAALERALAKAPGARWATAAELRDALRADGGEEMLPDDLEAIDGAYARILFIFTATGGALALAPIVGLTTGSVLGTVAAGAALPAIAAAALWAFTKFDRWRRPVGAERRERIALRPPRWWSAWWPKRYRRPGDMWDRLPREMRLMRTINVLTVGVLAPLQVAGMFWLFSDAGIGTLALFRVEHRPLVNLIFAGIGGLAVAIIGSIGLLAWRLRRRLTIDTAHLRQLQTLANADPKWRHPRYAILLEAPAQPKDTAPSTAELIRALRAASVPLPDGLTNALDAVSRGDAALERQLRELREMVNAEEIERVEKRLAALGSGDPSLRAMLESQRSLLARAEARIGELGALRARFDAQQGLLRQQLIALRDLAPSGADVSEITGKIRAVNADLRALAEGLAET